MHDGNTDRATEGAPDGATVHIPGVWTNVAGMSAGLLLVEA